MKDSIENYIEVKDNKNLSIEVSRYRTSKSLKLPNGLTLLETAPRLVIRPSSDDYIHEVKSGEEHRLDLLAYRYYSNPLLYWVIACFNSLENPMEVPAGTVLRIPSPSSLWGLNGVLSV